MSPTDIANQSLSLLGDGGQISSYDENSTAAIAIRTHYDTVRKGLLRSHRWNFARARAQLTASATAPAFDWSYAYPLPVTCLRLLKLNGRATLQDGDTFEIEGRSLLTNEDEAKIVYVQDVTDPDLWDSLFVEAMVLKLAAAVAVDVTDSFEKQRSLEGRYEGLKLPEALRVDANESKSRVIQPGEDSALLASRGVALPYLGSGKIYGSVETIGSGSGAGEDGDNGWSPLLAVVSDGARRVVEIVGWEGGTGAAPETGYVGTGGIVASVGDGTNIRGDDGREVEIQVDGGYIQWRYTGESWSNLIEVATLAGDDGDNGWTPILALVADGDRFVHQVTDWTGGEGTKPTTGLYVGATGLEANIADGVDVRGPAGLGSGDVVGPAGATADRFASYNGTTGKLIKDSGFSSSSFATAAQGSNADAAKAKTDFLTVTGAVNLDTIATNVATNNAKVTNATHTGDVTGSGALTIATNAVTTTKVADGNITLAKLADLAASRVIGRKTSTGVPESLTLSEVLDFIGSAASGDILYRGASSWQRLPKGTDGQALILAAGVPSWGTVGGGGKILQVVQAAQTAVVSFSSVSTNTFVDISGMSVSITPSATSSKVLIFVVAHVTSSIAGLCHVRLMRGSTAISVGDSAGSRLQDSTGYRNDTEAFSLGSVSVNFLDSPATTSATTYKIQGTLGASYNGTFYLNRQQTDDNADYSLRPVSSIIAMEVGA